MPRSRLDLALAPRPGPHLALPAVLDLVLEDEAVGVLRLPPAEKDAVLAGRLPSQVPRDVVSLSWPGEGQRRLGQGRRWRVFPGREQLRQLEFELLRGGLYRDNRAAPSQ